MITKIDVRCSQFWRISLLILPLLLLSSVVNADVCAPVNITSVKYLGKFPKPGIGTIDKVQINYTLGPSPCAFIQNLDFKLGVHRPNRKDEGTASTSNLALTTITIEVPRGPLERDPDKYDLQVRTKINARKGNGVRVSGTGVPTLTGAQITEIFPPNPAGEELAPPAACKSPVSITALSYQNPASPSPETISLSYNVSQPQQCIKLEKRQHGVVITRVSGPQTVVGPVTTAGELTASGAGNHSMNILLPATANEGIQSWAVDLIFFSEIQPNNPFDDIPVNRLRFSFN